MTVKGNGGTVFISALDLECQTVSGDRRTSPFFGCSRASVQPFHSCVHGRTGSAAVFIDKQKMWFSGPFYCKIDHGQITGTNKQAPTSAYWHRAP